MLNQKPATNTKYNSGIYYPKDLTKIIKLNDKGGLYYRSGWELKMMIYLDNKPEVRKWGAELIEIQYYDIKGQSHRYYPDFYAEMATDDPNVYKRMVLEIKPYKETLPPVVPKNANAKSLESFEYQMKMFQKNQYKWNKAKEFCENRDLLFFLVTEKHLNK